MHCYLALLESLNFEVKKIIGEKMVNFVFEAYCFEAKKSQRWKL